MKCKSCGLEMFIESSKYEVCGDNSPDTKTEIYSVPYFKCRNPECRGKDELIKGERTALI